MAQTLKLPDRDFKAIIIKQIKIRISPSEEIEDIKNNQMDILELEISRLKLKWPK